jgi:hypothetical protein
MHSCFRLFYKVPHARVPANVRRTGYACISVFAAACLLFIHALQKTPDLQSHEEDAGPEDDKSLWEAGEACVRHTEDAAAVQTKSDRIAGIDQSAKTAEAERTIGVEAASSSAASSMWYSLRNLSK